jgi:UDP-N-acetylmuramoyl-L-alanyl-D-glutamate--2,6-diaminopimelate ligase
MISVPFEMLAASVPNARILSRAPVLIQRLTADSRDARPGDLFACVRGHTLDGHRFAAAAVRQGASAVLLARRVPGLDPRRTAQLLVPDVAQSLAALAPVFYNQPSQRLNLVGVTGTNGKTTITYFTQAILERAGGTKSLAPVGLLGTIAYDLGRERVSAPNTTPMAWEVQRRLQEMTERRCAAAVMEVSSHALVEGRVADCEFDVAVFTNLTPEHLDFHRTLARYAAAKRLLFGQLGRPGHKPGPKWAVINADDPYGASMGRAARGARVVTFGLAQRAAVTAEQLRLRASASRFRLQTPHGSVAVEIRLPGRHNVQNALAAAAAAQCLGAPLSAIRQGLSAVTRVPGRMQRVPGPQPFQVLVDYAHTPDALEKVLTAAREFTPGRLTVVFGCGGNRDASKRAPMGAIAVRLADRVVVTSDNPRQEAPGKIIAQILEGCRPKAACTVQPDRKRAIALALSAARSGDTVLIAGKGHETYQLVAGRSLPFDDQAVAAAWLAHKGRRHAWKT